MTPTRADARRPALTSLRVETRRPAAESARSEPGSLHRTTLEETELVRGAVSGDPDAFAQLYDAYVERVYRYIFFRVGETQTAEDLTAQTFFKAWENVDRYRMRGLPFGAWLFRIARNIVIDHYRTHREMVDLEAVVTRQPDASVEEEVEKLIEVDCLKSALHHLSDDQRQVLTLKFVDGLSTAEVAQVMGKRCGAIRALQMRGLQSLRSITTRAARSSFQRRLHANVVG